MKSAKQMERNLKGMANHYRIQIILLVGENPGISLQEIAKKLRANAKTIGEHTRRLFIAGLLDKKYHSRFVAHKLSPYGRICDKFLRSFRSIK